MPDWPSRIAAVLRLRGLARATLAPQPKVADDREARTARGRAFVRAAPRRACNCRPRSIASIKATIAGCESRLATLVQRRPDFVPARLRLAEIVWSRGDAAAAEQHYLAVLSPQPDLAEAHHGLGTLLESEGRFDEAAERFDPQRRVLQRRRRSQLTAHGRGTQTKD